MGVQAYPLKFALHAAPDVVLRSPLVRVQAQFNGQLGTWGSGFLIGEWPSSVITARHVVTLSNGGPPSDVVVMGWSGSQWIPLPTGIAAFWEGGLEAPDIAIVRLRGRATATSPLQMGQLEGSVEAQIWGYPLLAAGTSKKNKQGRAKAIATEATKADDFLNLSLPGLIGMSGGPIVVPSSNGAAPFAIGIYLGSEGSAARAHVLDSSVVKDAKDAAMNLA